VTSCTWSIWLLSTFWPKKASWWSHPLPGTIPQQEDPWFRHSFQAQYRERIWMLLWCWFLGNQSKAFSNIDPSTFKSRSGWVIFYAGCPIIRASKLQSQTALSTTKAKYIANSMTFLWRHSHCGSHPGYEGSQYPRHCSKSYVYCKVFEENLDALKLARLPKLCSRTKHTNVLCYHHFCKHMQKGLIKIFPGGTTNQITDVLTKALAQMTLYVNAFIYVANSSPSYKSEGV